MKQGEAVLSIGAKKKEGDYRKFSEFGEGITYEGGWPLVYDHDFLVEVKLQELTNQTNKTITVLHFPPGTSKWTR
jgi:hypothetical protein